VGAPTGAAIDPERKARLLQAKLHALVRDHTGTEGGQTGGHAGAAVLHRDEAGWFLADDNPRRALGPALAWARQQRVTDLAVVIDDADAATAIARRADQFATPPRVYRVEGRALVLAEPGPYRASDPAPEGIESLIALLEQAGADVVVEHGAVTGEWLGLEIARVVPTEQGPRLEVGVGRHDREAFQLLYGDVPRIDALRSVVEAARTHRRPGAEGHPLTRLVPERWLRSRIVADPHLVGAEMLAAVEPIEPRESVKDVVPAGAVGRDLDGRPLVVVCSVGVDLDLVPEAADLRARHAGGPAGDGARLALVLPERDALPATRALAAALREPAEVITVPDDWRASQIA
jgi:hypothetical protein